MKELESSSKMKVKRFNFHCPSLQNKQRQGSTFLYFKLEQFIVLLLARIISIYKKIVCNSSFKLVSQLNMPAFGNIMADFCPQVPKPRG